MKKLKFIKKFDAKYLVSGPAPLGRILNYLKRIKLSQYKTSKRGNLSDPDNLDNWTICFMVGLGLIGQPIETPHLKIKLTKNGEEIYNAIKHLPDFIDRPGRSKQDMLKMKEDLKKHNVKVYQKLKDIFLTSISLKNLAIFFGLNKIRAIDRQRFYKEYGKVFSIDTAGFNRLPSLVQIAQFCDVLIEDGTKIQIYDLNYIDEFIILEADEAVRNIVAQDLKKAKPRKTKQEEIDDQSFLQDLSGTILPEKKEVIVRIYKRYNRLVKKLKKLYNSECQICGFTFTKKNGENYSEGHHIIPLGERGSEEIKNMLILCANCHRQIHYNKPEWKNFGVNSRQIKLSGKLQEVKYKSAHFNAVREADIS